MSSRFCAFFCALAFGLPAFAAENALPHAQYLPPDDAGLRQERPEQQHLVQISEYAVVIGNQRQSSQQPIPITTPTWLRLKGKTLGKQPQAMQVLIAFDSEGKSLKRPAYDEASRTLTLNYPMAQYAALVDLLRNGPVYCQFLVYANGHVWADLHSGAVRVR
ncbi:hypothetical protein [Pseudomonas mangiferae]|uniref:Uncharacterized protein n=1 Tax=Pseudomonas mangiferae TaxID=2593654 RepID=A0A553H0Z7_9PSED|nr:hypothetical protein [Pseudomonas mangiferae]TRX75429.1 hypothetical protein FM069_06735 [Pseudomonas mangiferae]